MKKRVKKLGLHRETLRNLQIQTLSPLRPLPPAALRHAAGGDYVSLKGCSWGCDSVDSELFTSCNHCGEEA